MARKDITVSEKLVFPANMSSVDKLILRGYYNGSKVKIDGEPVYVTALAIMEVAEAGKQPYMITVMKTDHGILYTSSEAVRNSLIEIIGHIENMNIDFAALKLNFRERTGKESKFNYIVPELLDVIEK